MTDLHIPENWTFKSQNVAENFESHVREQLPWYDLATQMVVHIVRHYLPEGGKVLDIGAATGNIGHHLKGLLSDRNAEFIPVDNSVDMISRYKGPGNCILGDGLDVSGAGCDVVVAFLTTMFFPVRRRQRWLEKMQLSINAGGAVILVDRFLPGSSYEAIVATRLTLACKMQSTTPEEILKKEMSLAGVQRPLSRSELPSDAAQMFQFGDFAGYVIPSGNNG